MDSLEAVTHLHMQTCGVLVSLLYDGRGRSFKGALHIDSVPSVVADSSNHSAMHCMTVVAGRYSMLVSQPPWPVMSRQPRQSNHPLGPEIKPTTH